jgi:hypothetical protein
VFVGWLVLSMLEWLLLVVSSICHLLCCVCHFLLRKGGLLVDGTIAEYTRLALLGTVHLGDPAGLYVALSYLVVGYMLLYVVGGY